MNEEIKKIMSKIFNDPKRIRKAVELSIEDQETYLEVYKKAYLQGAKDGINKYYGWIAGNIEDEQVREWCKGDIQNAISDTMDWCAICNKANGKLSEEGICKDCL